MPGGALITELTEKSRIRCPGHKGPRVGVGGPADPVPAPLAPDRRWADDDVVSGANVVSRMPPGSMRDAASDAHPHVDLEITGMTCASCVRRVEQALEKVDGVVSAAVNLATELAGVDVGEKVDAESLTAAVRNAGYEARIVAPERSAMVAAAERRLRRRADVRRRARQLGVGVLLSGVTLLLSYGFGSWRWSGYLQLAVALPVWLWVGWKFHRGALRAARHGSANMDTLVSLGSSVAFIYSAVAVFVLPGQATFFDVAALIVTLISVGTLPSSDSFSVLAKSAAASPIR